ncbi:MAG: ACP S-malonyltransferase, partial [Chitinophagaceae bacterium]
AFHSPLMKQAELELTEAIHQTTFHKPSCPVYQNVVAAAVTDPDAIKQNLILQLTGPVKWTQCVQAMVADGAQQFTEAGPGKVLQGLIAKIHKEAQTNGVS